MFLEKGAQKIWSKFQNTFSGERLAASDFLELLALEIIESNDVQICQFILIGLNQTSFFHGHIISFYINHLMYDSFSKKI